MTIRRIIDALMRHENKPAQVTIGELVHHIAGNGGARFTIDNTHMNGLMQVHEFVMRDENIMVFCPNGRVVMHNLADLRPPMCQEVTPADLVGFVSGYVKALGDVRSVTLLP